MNRRPPIFAAVMITATTAMPAVLITAMLCFLVGSSVTVVVSPPAGSS